MSFFSNIFSLCLNPADGPAKIQKAIVAPTDGKKGSHDIVTDLVVNSCPQED
jgi:hypothetical protein